MSSYKSEMADCACDGLF